MTARCWWLVPASLLAAAPARAHAPAGEPGEWVRLWGADPWIVGPLVLAIGLFSLGAVRLDRRVRAGSVAVRRPRRIVFLLGWAVAAIALLSPLDAAGEALFSAHMVQHELLMVVAAPLLLIGAPGPEFAWAVYPMLRWKRVTAVLQAAKALWRFLTQPTLAWGLHALILWAWHIPVLFQAGLRSDAIHSLQHISFFVAALVFWASLWHTARTRGAAVLSLFTTGLHASALGALLTFSPAIWYPAYEGSTWAWGLSPLEDQQLGGLIMWMPGGLAYLAAGLVLMGRLLAHAPAPEPGSRG